MVIVNEVVLLLLRTVYLIHAVCLRLSRHLLCFLLKIELFLPENEKSWSQQILLHRHCSEPVLKFKT